MEKENNEFIDGTSFDIVIERMDRHEEFEGGDSPINSFSRNMRTYSVKRPRVTSSYDKNWTVPGNLAKHFNQIDYDPEDDNVFISGFYLSKPGDVDNMISLLEAIKDRMVKEDSTNNK